jgi:hypothetical protein
METMVLPPHIICLAKKILFEIFVVLSLLKGMLNIFFTETSVADSDRHGSKFKMSPLSGFISSKQQDFGPEPQGAETFVWSRSSNKLSAPAPGQEQESHTLILIYHKNIP